MNANKKLIKICGVKSELIAYEAARFGANFIGMIFHKESKRNIDLNAAKNIVRSAVQGGASPVAVCVDQTAKEIIKICEALAMSVVQLHGCVARDQHQRLPKSITRIYVIPVNVDGTISGQHENNIKKLKTDRDYLLFDGLVGGSGTRITTDGIQEIAGRYRYFIAGGLTIHNIGEVIDKSHLHGVDVSTGVEDAQGNKDIEIIKKFISAVNLQGGL